MKTNIFFRTAIVLAALYGFFGCTNPEVEIYNGGGVH